MHDAETAAVAATTATLFPYFATMIGALATVVGALILKRVSSIESLMREAIIELRSEDRTLHSRISDVDRRGQEQHMDLDRRVTRVETRCDGIQRQDGWTKRCTDPSPE